MTDRPSQQQPHRGASEWLELERAITDAIERSQSLGQAAPLILGALARAQERSRSEKLLTQAEQAADTGSFEFDLDTGDAHYSAGLRRILSMPEDLSLTHELFLSRVHPEDRDLVARCHRARPPRRRAAALRDSGEAL